jgi:tRNA uridine 5-carbamoylmethylation protein Kti12
VLLQSALDPLQIHVCCNLEMPLIVISGRPCGGKTHVANRIAEELRTRYNCEDIIIVNDECSSTFTRDVYNDSHKVV